MIPEIERNLNNHDSARRHEAIVRLASLIKQGKIKLPHPAPQANIHIHSFFSYNSEGWSPSRIAWEAAKNGLEIAGIVDFDALDGLEEFLQAGDLLELKAVVGLETRVFIPELADKVITSPNEPGIHYVMVQGAVRNTECGIQSVESLKAITRQRNEQVIGRINNYLPDIALDYAQDVLLLTPSGNATERHLLLAYDMKARKVFGDGTADFWAGIIGLSEAETNRLMCNEPAFHEKMRSVLIKYGGAGYIRPDSSSFPTIDEITCLAKEVGGIPTTAWLDGMSEGESDITANLEFMVSKGITAVNIIPDRNWNIKDPVEKEQKLEKLKETVKAARNFHLPLSIGTEMNRSGQPFVDDFTAPELADYVDDFLFGARFFYGHTLLSRFTGFGYCSEAAEAAFGDDRKARNEFFARAGSLARPDEQLYERLSRLSGQPEPGDILEAIQT